jgi:molecular chaperone DnaK
MIPKNTTVPTSKSQTFSTAADNQTSVEIHVLQGERPMAADNRTLARFVLDGIPPSPRGLPQVEVTFDIDANGILNVSAKDKTTGKSQSVKIEASTSLSKEEIEKLKNEASAYAAEDTKKRDLADTKNQAETLIYTAEKAIKDAGDKVPAEMKTGITDKIEMLKKSLLASLDASRSGQEDRDVEALKSGIAELSAEIQKIGQSVYNKGDADQSGEHDKGDNKGESS